MRSLHILRMCSHIQECIQGCISEVIVIRQRHLAAVCACLPQFTKLVTIASFVVMCLPNFLELASSAFRVDFCHVQEPSGFHLIQGLGCEAQYLAECTAPLQTLLGGIVLGLETFPVIPTHSCPSW